MARSLTSNMAAEVVKPRLRPILLAAFEFDSGALRLWSGIGELSWDGETWTGAGTLLGIGEVTETAAVRAAGVQFRLSGVPASLISLALTEDYQFRPVSAWLGAIDDSGAVIGDPYKVFAGTMDTLEHTDSGDTADFVLLAENRLAALEVANKQLYTPERQKLDYAGDLGFDQVPSLQDQEIIWGRS